MPASPLNLSWPGGRVLLDEQAGVLLQPEGAAGSLRVGFCDAGLAPVLLDDSAAEHEGAGDGVSISQRVTVADHCQLRWVVEAGDQPASSPLLEITGAVGQYLWLWPSGADALVAAVPATGAGPVLALQVVQGGLWKAGESEDGRTLRLALTPDGLGPGQRQSTVLRALALPDLASASTLLPPWYEPLTLAAGEDWAAPLADLGVDSEPPVKVEYSDGDHTVRVTAPAGRHRLGVHGRRGVTELEFEVAPTPADLLRESGERALAAGPLDAAGALVVHRAVGAGYLPQHRVIEDALDRFDWTARGEPLAIAFGSERALAEGERQMAAEAVRQLAELPSGPGRSQVRSLVWFAASALGVDTAPIDTELPGSGPAPLEDDLLLGRRTPASVAGLEAAINRLGAGLPGRPVGLGHTEQAFLVGLLESCPEGWPEAPLAGATAQVTRQRIQAGYAAGEIVDPTPLAWLLVSG